MVDQKGGIMSFLVFYGIGSLIILLSSIYRLYKHPEEDVTLIDSMFTAFMIIFS